MQLGDMIFSALDRLGPLPYTLEDLARFALPKVPPGRALADVEKETLRAMAEVLLDECPVDVPFTEMVDRFERFLVQGQSKRGWRCRMLLTLVEYAPIAAYGRPVRMMSIEQRRRYMREQLIRGGFPWSTCAKIRYLVYAGAYGHTAADAATGFVPYAQRPRASAVASEVLEVRHEA
jgi:hypothetical protein